MDTAPLPTVPASPPPRPGGALRALEAAAGLASGGLVVIGVVLVAVQLTAPQIAPGTGLAAASGPTWWRALTQLGVGLVGEALRAGRSRLPYGARAWCAFVFVVAVVAVLWWCWWR